VLCVNPVLVPPQHQSCFLVDKSHVSDAVIVADQYIILSGKITGLLGPFLDYLSSMVLVDQDNKLKK
jgi:hypothetical protein